MFIIKESACDAQGKRRKYNEYADHEELHQYMIQRRTMSIYAVWGRGED